LRFDGELHVAWPVCWASSPGGSSSVRYQGASDGKPTGKSTTLGGLDQRRDPKAKRFLEGARIEDAKDTTEGVMRWDPALQVQEGRQEVALGASERRDAREGFRPAEDCQQRDDQDVDQRVSPRALDRSGMQARLEDPR